MLNTNSGVYPAKRLTGLGCESRKNGMVPERVTVTEMAED